jgi:predicted alpha/beta-hydrolase family hydrolase
VQFIVIVGGPVCLSSVQSRAKSRCAGTEVIALAADPELLFNGPTHAAMTIALAHGAGAAMDSPFMDFFATGLADRGFRVARFEFPYMASKRATGKRMPPDREPVLRETWLKVIKVLGNEGLVIGGKSMGGRIASLIADEAEVAALVCLGYPFHPTGKPGKLRVEHLRTIKTPTLIVQGARDPFGSHEEVAGYELSPNVLVKWLRDGEHSFKPRKNSGRTERQNWEEAVEEIGGFPGGEMMRNAGLRERSTVNSHRPQRGRDGAWRWERPPRTFS